MIDYNIITPCLFNVLGWKNTLDTCEKQLDTNIFNTVSDTGMFYNLNSELLTLPNLQAIAPNADLFEYDNYSGGTVYSEGKIVRFDKLLYKSLTNSNQGNTPSTDPINWQLLYPFSDWLEDFTNTTILRFAQSIVNLKKNDKQSKALMVDTPVYNGSGNLANVGNYVPDQNKFVGLEIDTIPNKDVDLRIKKIGLHFVDIQTDLPIYIYHSSQLNPLQTINVSTTTAKSFIWVDIEDILLNYTDSYASDGCFYIGYYQEDVTGRAINNDRFNFKAPCLSCNRTGRKYWDDFNKFVNVNSFSVADGNYTKGEMWNDELNQYGSNTFGLNISFTAECTLNSFICENSQMFAKGLLRQAELLFCEYAINTNRTNELAERMANIAGINLDTNGLLDLQKQVDEEIKASNFDLSDLNSPCATKQKTKRSMFRSI